MRMKPDPRGMARANMDAERDVADAIARCEVKPEPAPTGPLPDYVAGSGLDVLTLRPRKARQSFTLTEDEWRRLWLLENPHRTTAQVAGHAPDPDRVARRFALTFVGPRAPASAEEAIQMARAIAGHALDETAPEQARTDRHVTERERNQRDHRARGGWDAFDRDRP